MTQPYQPQYAAPQYPQQAPPQQPQYAPQAPQYAPPQPPAYGYPPQQAPAPQQWAPQPGAYGYPPQQGAYPTQQAPAQTPVSASLSDFYSQPSSGWGPSITPIGATPDNTQILMVVAQHITKAHVEHKEEFNKPGVLAYYRNGSPKLQMKLPVNVAPGTQYWTKQGPQQVADGRAQYYLGKDKDLLGAAIAQAGGNAADPPELGCVILATKTHNRPTQGQPSPVVTYQYWRPGPEAQQLAAQFGVTYPDLNTPKPADNAPVQEAPAPAPAPSAGPGVQQQAAPAQPVMQQPAAQMQVPQQFQPPAPGNYAAAPGQAAQPAPSPMAQAPQMQAQPPAAAPPVAPWAPAGLSADKAALLASLTGGAPLAPPAA